MEALRSAPRAVEILAGRLGERGATASDAIEVLGEMTNRHALPLLTGVLKGGDHLLRSKALDALGKFPDDTEAIQALISALDHIDPFLRRGAVDCLWRSRHHPDAVAALSRAVADDADSEVRAAAARTLEGLSAAGEEAKAVLQRYRERQKRALDDAERVGSQFKVECQRCGRACDARGRPLLGSTVMVMTPETAGALARYCVKCNMVVCGKCTGADEGGLRLFAACPVCNDATDYAAASHIRRTQARVIA